MTDVRTASYILGDLVVTDGDLVGKLVGRQAYFLFSFVRLTIARLTICFFFVRVIIRFFHGGCRSSSSSSSSSRSSGSSSGGETSRARS